jgi:hypothetical protein
MDPMLRNADTGQTKRQVLSGLALLREARRQCSLIVPTVCPLEGAVDAGACFRRCADGIVRQAGLVQQPFDVGCSMQPRIFSDEHPTARGRAVP